MKSFKKFVLLYIFFASLITIPWQLYEIFVYGETKPSTVDSVIAIVLAYVLAGIVMYFQDVRKSDETHHKSI